MNSAPAEPEKKQLPTAPEWVETPTARRILAALSYARMAGDVVVAYGAAGTGKTSAVRAASAGRDNVWTSAMSPAASAVGPCLRRVAEACGAPQTGAAARIESALIARLSGSGGLLIVDEAQHLGVRALDQLRCLHDAAGIGLALVGNDRLRACLTGRTAAAAPTPEFAQLSSRVGKWVRLTRVGKRDVEMLLRAWSIDGAEERAAALAIAGRPGGLRGLTKTLRLAALFAAADKDAGKDGENPPGARHIRAAWKDLGGEL